MEIAATGTTIWLHESSLISFMGNTRLRYSGLTVSFWVEYVMLCSSMYKPPPMIPLRHKLHTKVFPIILPPPISWWLVKLSISYWFPEEHPYIGDFSRFTAYVRTRDWYARTQRFARSAPYIAVSPSESPLHFADRRAESVIVGYYTSAEVPFPRRRQPGAPLWELSVRRIYIAHRRCKQGFQRGAAPLAHDFGTKSSVLHLSRGVYVPEMQKAPYPTP